MTCDQNCDCCERVERLEDRVRSLEAEKATAEEKVDELEDSVTRLRGMVQNAIDKTREHEQQLYELDDRVDHAIDSTRLIETAQKNAAGPMEQRVASVLQTLYNKAVSNGQLSSQRASASMTANEARSAVGGSISRQQCYEVLERAEEIVGEPDVLWYQKESRSSKKNTRLILDLEQGELPAVIHGQQIRPRSPSSVGGDD